jgi:hypothetical protein
MDQLAACPLLQKIVHTYVWVEDKDQTFWLTDLQPLLNVSWDKLRGAICRLRPIFAEYFPDLAELSAFIHNMMVNPPTWREKISMDLAVGCIRLRRKIDSGRLPGKLW